MALLHRGASPCARASFSYPSQIWDTASEGSLARNRAAAERPIAEGRCVALSEIQRRTAMSTFGLLANLSLCFLAFVRGLHFEGTHEAILEAQNAQQIAICAVPGVITALVGRRRSRVGMIAATLSVVLALAGAVLWWIGRSAG